jgi:hypothetical protein
LSEVLKQKFQTVLHQVCGTFHQRLMQAGRGIWLLFPSPVEQIPPEHLVDLQLFMRRCIQ